ncbi:hypothetical protein TNCT_16371 [Trichonephila clavata]|uniref:Uncharacterized protein n=1 Tax=Trichonephila clavata TaxID=2740835 RepID=A0A8X6J9I2_TRICU|nr:hypothetical protein TNCT_16371 [Trichonephila clavata]
MDSEQKRGSTDLAFLGMWDGLTVTRPPVYAAGYRNVCSDKARHSPGVEGFLTELWIHRPYVLMHEGWSYRDPSDQYKWQGSVMFVATRHNIHSAEWKVSEQNCGSIDLAF